MRKKGGLLKLLVILVGISIIGGMWYYLGFDNAEGMYKDVNQTTVVFVPKDCEPCDICTTPEPKVIQTNHTIYINHTKWLPCNESKDIKIIRQLKWCEGELAERRNQSILLEVIEHINESLKLNSSALDQCLLDLCDTSNRTKGCREGE